MRWRGPLIVAGVAALLALTVLTTGPAGAGHCGYGYGYPVYYPPYRPAYCAPAPYCPPAAVAVVKEPPHIVQQVLPVVVEQILAPAVVFQTLSAYQVPQAAGQAYTGQQGAYGFGQQYSRPTAPAALAKAGYGSGGGYGATQAGLSEADLDALAARLATKLGGVASNSDPVPRIGSNGNGNGNDQGRAPPRNGNEPSQAERGLIEYMAGACVECHRAPNAKGGLTLFTAAGDFQPSSTRKQITPAILDEAMRTDFMPPNGRRADKALLDQVGWGAGR